MSTATETKERPILFSAREVRAILDGRKTQIRRVVTKPHIFTEAENFEYRDCWIDSEGNCWGAEDAWELCPYGKPGDRLWGRETWFVDTVNDSSISQLKEEWENGHGLYYRADGECCQQIPECCVEVGPPKWRPSTNMPKWASRISLELTDVRVQRLQEITGDDAVCEGIEPRFLTDVDIDGFWDAKSAVSRFHELWDALNAKHGYPWESNPWVWAITFKRCDGES